MIVLAHPLTERAELPLSPLEIAALALYVLLVVAAIAHWRTKGSAREANPAPSEFDQDAVPETRTPRIAFWLARGVGLAVFALAVAAGLWGDTTQVANITPALVIGAGWPLLTLASLIVGVVWWWVNPYDTVGRVVAEAGAGQGSAAGDDGAWAPVWWALVPAAVWMLYLTTWRTALSPRTIGWTMVAYAFITVVGVLALGRKTWVWRAEFLTVFFGLIAQARRRAATSPAGAAALLGVVCGGALFGLVRDSDLGLIPVSAIAGPWAGAHVALAFILLSAILADQVERRAPRSVVATALAPMAVGLVVALGIARNRLTTSLQLLPITASNPLGGDLNLFGTWGNPVNPAPLGELGPVWLQIGVLLAGAVVGLLLAVRRRRVGVSPSVAGARSRRGIGVISVFLGIYLVLGVAAVAAI